MMRKCAILTMDKLDDFVVYDQMLNEPLIEQGWDVEQISWHSKNVDWNDYEVVIIRSTWDYQDHSESFLLVLSQIEQSQALLLNSLPIVQWNIDKSYLKDVQKNGVDIVPTLWLDVFDFALIDDYFEHFSTDQLVIKPTISANADNTHWLKRSEYGLQKEMLEKSLCNRQLMVQPFIQSIVDNGEYSLFYFSGVYSHAIMKTPKSGDFRVQEEHGGLLKKIEPSQSLLSAAEKALSSIPEKVLYARIDLVEHEGAFKLMEIELIEPSLYFNLDETAAPRFAKAVTDWLDHH